MNEVNASVIVNNHNYGRFLVEAIESALNQTHEFTEVIVVDDGSTDGSRDIAVAFAPRVKTIFKEQAGQTSAFNAGFAASQGDIICFLDSDDTLSPRVMEKSAELMADKDVVKVHWPLQEVDVNGQLTGKVWPTGPLAAGDLSETVLSHGPDAYPTPPGSGIAWKREFLAQVFPLDELETMIGGGSAAADCYLSMLAPLFGKVRSIASPHGTYRIHGDNDFAGQAFEQTLTRGLKFYDHAFDLLELYARQHGFSVDPAKWRQDSWYHRLDLAVQDLEEAIPATEPFVLLDDHEWGMTNSLRLRSLSFPEQGGRPSDDRDAIEEFERLRDRGHRYLVVGWPAFWWLDYYSGFGRHLAGASTCLISNERIKIFQLQA